MVKGSSEPWRLGANVAPALVTTSVGFRSCSAFFSVFGVDRIYARL
jgi:flagellar motor component MotA